MGRCGWEGESVDGEGDGKVCIGGDRCGCKCMMGG